VPVTTAAAWIEALLARRPEKPLVERVTGLPYAWALWVRGLPVLPDRQLAQAMVAEVARRPRVPRVVPVPTASLLQGFRRLWWQNDEPPPPDQRGLRWLAGSISLLLHLLFALGLVLASLLHLVPPTASSEGERVEVQFMGRGTPELAGEGTAAANAEAVSSAASPAAASAPLASATPDVVNPVDAEPVASALPAVAQPLQVTETAEPSSEFVLPPTTPPAIAAITPQLRMPEVEVRASSIALAQPAPVVAAVVPRTTVRAEIVPREVQVREREVVIAVAPPVQVATVPAANIQARLRTPELGVREMAIPDAPVRPAPVVAAAEPAVVPATATKAVPVSAPAAEGAPAVEMATKTPAVPVAGASRGAGPLPQDRSGGWSSPARADDWGAARAGANAKPAGNIGQRMFNADGSVRLASSGPGDGEPRRGAPGSDADSWTRDQIAAAGTWLKRPPYNHTPTSFDKYWVPSESLLAEWVRKGIKNIEIPIPGTNSKLSCVVSLLQFGGGCGLSNPNMQEQPAQARPPPDIPFKKELQEDNGSR
jgi:hypothetical protein